MCVSSQKTLSFLALALGAGKAVGVKSMEGADKMMTKGAGGAGGGGWHCVLVAMAEKERALRMWKQPGRGLRVMDDDDLIQGLILGRIE